MDGNDAMQAQMFRYAQDLHELMDQQTSLQKRYQLLLHSLGRGGLSEDQLPSLLLDAVDLHLVTDESGALRMASPAIDRALRTPGGTLKGQFIQQLMPPDQAANLQTLLSSLICHGSNGAIERRQLVLLNGLQSESTRLYDALIMAVKNRDSLEIYWFLGREVDPYTRELDISQSFSIINGSEDGLVIVDEAGKIQAVNPAVSRITGFSQSELMGEHLHAFRSELHDEEFYPDLWRQLLGTGSWTGEIFNRRKNGQIYLSWKTIKAIKNVTGATVAYIASFADMSRGNIDTRQLTRLAFHDHLTGLPNRRMLEERLREAMTTASQEMTDLSILVLDLDHFKPINDELGHDVGDLVLQAVGARIQASVRRVDTCARVGGDEFVVVLHRTTADADVERIAQSILFAISEPINVGQRELRIEASIGCARYPQDAQNMTTLLKNADVAMYGAKRLTSRFSFYKVGHD